jgi:hypothetical protein
MTVRILASVVLAGAVAATALAYGAPDPTAEFADRVDQYVSLRARLAAPLPPIDGSRGWSSLLGKRYLASALRAARSEAQQGDLFTPPVAAMFRDRLAMLTAAERLLPGLAAGDEGTPLLLVNEPLADEWMTPVPPRALHALPALPNGLVYRFVHADLILWDAYAEIVVDVLPDALR